jgi:hypothetical protein
MELKELESELEEIENQYKKQRSEAIKKYCIANNKVEIGDIVQSNAGGEIIKVEKIIFSAGWNKLAPECIYEGARLRKDFTPRLDGKKGTVFQSRMINHVASAE